MSIHLHIDRLVLDGIDTGGMPQLLQAALESELARLLGEGSLAVRQGRAVASLKLPEIGLQAGEPAASLGTRIAAAVAGGLAP